MGKLIPAAVLLMAVAISLRMLDDGRFDPKSVRGQRVLVTGASTGIGQQLAYEYARLGARLVVTARREGLLRDVARACRQLGAKEVHFVAADMAVPEDRGKVVASVQERLGGLDHLVLNHALVTNFWWLGSAENLTTLDQVFRVNFLAPVDLATQALPMLAASRGRIGVVSSVLGKVGASRANAYGAAKFALHGFFSSLRQELRHKDAGVSVTFAVLGAIGTDMLLSFRDQGYSHMSMSFSSAPEAAARAIVENVTQRSYSFVFDWQFRFLMILNDFFPEAFEDVFSDVMQNRGGTWLARCVLFFMHMVA